MRQQPTQNRHEHTTPCDQAYRTRRSMRVEVKREARARSPKKNKEIVWVGGYKAANGLKILHLYIRTLDKIQNINPLNSVFI